MTMRFPMHGIRIFHARLVEGIMADLLIVLEGRGFACDHAARKHDAEIICTGRLRKAKQRILAGPAWADHQNEPAESDWSIRVD